MRENDFFSKKECDRCHTSLEGKARTMSMFNTECLCQNCKNAEREHPLYKLAASAERFEVYTGNTNFKGIGMPEGEKIMNMSYEEFKQAVVENFKNYLPEEFEGKEMRVLETKKINCTMDTITFPDFRMSPTVYINRLYRDYMDGENLEDILKNTAKRVVKGAEDGKNIILDYASAKENIVFRIINTAQNKELLKGIPHRQFHDLSIIYYWMVSVEKYSGASILIHYGMAEELGLSEEELFSLATENTRRIMPPCTTNMAEVLAGYMGLEKLEENFPMWVMNNEQRLYGASCMLYEDVLFNLAEKLDSDLYILPSSIHEVICMDATMCDDLEVMQSMVKEINQEQVALEERLSNNVYYYSRENRTITMVTNESARLDVKAC